MINNKNLFDELFDEPEPEDHGIRNSRREYDSNNSKSSFQVEINKAKFKEWEQQLISAPGYPNNKESRLAIETLKICITESPIDDDIATNGYALFDYALLCYFVFRARLCADFPQNFVELYDTYIQNLLSLYFCQFFNIPPNTINGLIVQRAQKYESIVREDNAVYELTATLTQYIEKDLEGLPKYNGVLITSFTDNFELHIKLSDSVSATLNALNLLIVSTLPTNGQSSYEPPKQKRYHNCPTVPKTATKKRRNETARKKESEYNHIKSIFVCIPLSILGLLEFYLISTLIVLAIGLIFVILSYIPVLRAVSQWLIRMADSSTQDIIIGLSSVVAYIVLTGTVERVIKNALTRKFTLMAIGVLLTILNVVFLIINLINNEAALANVVFILVGIVLFSKAKPIQ